MLAPGTRLGPYEVAAPLGAGGMGEVYRARDTRLGRDVAVKVLPDHLAATADARARLDREAKAVSALNHPHICTLHDVGHEEGIDFLVMELVEGETLAQRLERGALPPAELLPLAIQIAGALDTAHRRGLVHRDLKPGNIMLTRTGAKLMDFGLARTVQPGAAPGDLTSSLTISRSLTTEGTLVGTFLYMAPEQLEGREADARSDLWALGCVLYEMATGSRAFTGKSQASLIGAIMQAEPPSLADHAPLAPPALGRLVAACLAKDPEERIQTAHDLKLQLQWVADGGSLAGVPMPVASRRRRRERLAWILAAALGAAAAAAGAMLLLREPPAPPAVVRFSMLLPPEARTATWPRISPDGRLLAFLAADSLGTERIWVRPLDALVATPLPGTENAGRPFWSPDSRQVGYFAGNQLRKVAVAGGPPQLVCETRSAADGTWGTAGIILFDGAAGDSIRQVPADGGIAAGATTMGHAQDEIQHAWPCFLPDGRHFLYNASVRGGTADWHLRLGSLDEAGFVDLGLIDSRTEFAPPDLVMYTAGSTLMARRLDLDRRQWRGDPFPVAEHVRTLANGQANFSVSSGGVLVTMTAASNERSELVWVDRDGKRMARVGEPAAYRDLALSPDGRKVAYGQEDPRLGTQDIWVRDLERGIASRLTFDDTDEIMPTWSPDGARIAYSRRQNSVFGVFVRRADGSGAADSLYGPPYHAAVTDWIAGGDTLIAMVLPNASPDLRAVPVAPGGATRDIVASRYAELGGTLSPDGRWLAYASNESGAPEVYVRAYPGPGGRWQVSAGGGLAPQWREDGRELFYHGNGGTALMAVPVETEGTFRSGTPTKLFDVNLTPSEVSRNRYVASADGRRFLLNVPLAAVREGIFDVVMNWTVELKR